jgi:D-glycero-alpha-D-manno-heptose-7-phosphate kinase
MPTPSVRAHAPVRVADCGGWSDTWFAEHGEVCHVAMEPGIEVIVGTGSGPGDEFLQACLVEAQAPAETSVEVVPTGIPLGAAVGTSASLAVAIIRAVDLLVDRPRTTAQLAEAAHRVETVQLGQQSGIQDQIAAAFGGVNHIVMTAYPTNTVRSLRLSASTAQALASGMVTVYLGRPHSSSAMHEAVIESLGSGDGLPALELIRQSATAAAAALVAGDLAAYGHALIAHHEAQRELHPDLVSADADQVAALAREHCALGWKTNGAGGEGGSVTVFAPGVAVAVERELAAAGFTTLRLRPAGTGATAIFESIVAIDG